jgi:hypothetical protein
MFADPRYQVYNEDSKLFLTGNNHAGGVLA